MNNDDDRGPWLGLRRVCTSCGRETIQQLEDGWCSQCNSPGEPPISAEERQQSIAELFEASITNLLQRGEVAAEKAEREKNESRRRYYCRLAEAYADQAMRMEAQRSRVEREAS